MSDLIKREDATAVISKMLGSLGNSVITEINSLSGYVTQDYARVTQDLISRQWLLDLYGTYIDGDVEEGKALFVPLEVVRQNIKDAPSAYPKTGEWVRTTEEINDCDGHRAYYWYECDNCGARPPKDQWGHEWHSDFCPNCGADMRGENHE